MSKKNVKKGAQSSSSERAQGLEDFFKFPRTRHIYDAGGSGVGRDDLVILVVLMR